MKTSGTLALLVSFLTFVSAAPAPQNRGGGGGRNRASTSQAVAGTTAAAAAAGNGGTGTGTGATASASASASNGGSGTGDTSSSDTGSSGSTSSGSGSGHDIKVINNCGGGRVLYKYKGQDLQEISGTKHITGPMVAGLMFLQDHNGVTCSNDGAGCSTVEFTLGDNDFNSINYSLLQDGLGDHDVQAPMYYTVQGPGCSKKADGVCNSNDDCPGAFEGTDTEGGTVTNCPGADGFGITVTFCP